jgi:NitT/TauT family transport system permease protein
VPFKGEIITTSALGETIYQATVSGNFSGLLAATSVMSLLVIVTNRLAGRPLYSWAEYKYQLLV